MEKQIDICSMCRFGIKNYTSVIGTIPWCCEKHWRCKPGSLASDYTAAHRREKHELTLCTLRKVPRI